MACHSHNLDIQLNVGGRVERDASLSTQTIVFVLCDHLVGGKPPSPLRRCDMGRKRANQVKVYFSDTEKENFDNLVKKSKLSQSEYMRRCLLDKEIIVVDGIGEMVKELKAIGNNLNQLTKIANTTGSIQGLDHIKSELSEVWEKVFQALKKVNK